MEWAEVSQSKHLETVREAVVIIGSRKQKLNWMACLGSSSGERWRRI